MSYKEKIKSEIKKVLNGSLCEIGIERTKTKEHGDVATNIAMLLAKEQKRNPLDIANEIKEKITSSNLISKLEVAKPGFINIVISDSALAESLSEVFIQPLFGFGLPKTKEKILVEYVSANPTGDLHIGHGRQAAIGSCLVNLLEASGHDVQSEFYINDYGEQIAKLSQTVWAIYKKLSGETVEWKEEFYPEELVLPYVKKALAEKIENITIDSLGQRVKDIILKSQGDLLSSFRVNFNKWFSETSLHLSGAVKETITKLKDSSYEHEGAIWFKGKDLGDVRDRVLVRADGRPTYLLPDIAYHIDKFSRGYSKLITIWGADHHGQEVSLKGGLKALGYDDSKLEIVFVQLVSLKKDGQEVKMSKRAGTVVTVQEVLDEVGADAFRYFLVESHSNNRMVFDIDLAKKQDKDNPVYYIQYAHARCCSIFRQAVQEYGDLNLIKNKELLLNLFLVNNQESEVTKSLVLKILDFPEEIALASNNRTPNRIANYLKDLACEFHQFYTICRVISKKEEDLTKARLCLVEAVKLTIANGLKILGITAPEAM